MVNKTIYMTYKKNVPDKVFNRWKELIISSRLNFKILTIHLMS